MFHLQINDIIFASANRRGNPKKKKNQLCNIGNIYKMYVKSIKNDEIITFSVNFKL